jgi:hypothetical protein
LLLAGRIAGVGVHRRSAFPWSGTGKGRRRAATFATDVRLTRVGVSIGRMT